MVQNLCQRKSVRNPEVPERARPDNRRNEFRSALTWTQAGEFDACADMPALVLRCLFGTRGFEKATLAQILVGEICCEMEKEAYLKKNWTIAAWLLCGMLVMPAFTDQGTSDSIDKGVRWVGTWASAPQLVEAADAPPVPGFADSTLRQVVHVSIGGKQMRVRFSNAFGTRALTITSAHVAVAGSGSTIRPESDKGLTFHGQPAVPISPGALMFSDAVAFDLAALSDLAVTVHLDGRPNGVTMHPGARATSYVQAGDWVSAADLPKAAQTDHWYFLNGVAVLAKSASAAIVTLGDSITDGRNSTTNRNGRWPDILARRLQANKGTTGIGVLNEGIGGNRLLRVTKSWPMQST